MAVSCCQAIFFTRSQCVMNFQISGSFWNGIFIYQHERKMRSKAILVYSVISHLILNRLKLDFNEVLFVLVSRELLCKIIKITTKFIFKKGSHHKKNLNNNCFRILFSGYIQMKVDTTLILAGCLDVTQYSLLRKWRQGTLICQEFSAPSFE